MCTAFTPDANAQPLMAQKDKGAVTVRWAAHDDNGDDLIYSVWYRGLGERNWRLLKDKISGEVSELRRVAAAGWELRGEGGGERFARATRRRRR